MKTWMKLAMPGACVVVAVAVSAGACSPTKVITNSTGGGACDTKAGAFPPPDCEDSTNDCSHVTPGCAINEAVCGSKSTCLPTADNTGKATLDLRFRRLNVTTPHALAQTFIQKGIVDQGINLKAPQCGENGDGAFNWLLRIDKTAGTLTTGGAPPTTDPFGLGFCFADTTSADGIHVKSVTGKITYTGASFSSEKIPKLNVPIFVHGDPSKLVILPLSQASLQNVTVSADGNCVGALSYNHINSDCSDVREDCSKWQTAGSLGGYITLIEADNVPIADLGGKTLCVMLTASTPGPDGIHCKRDASNNIAFTGDYCSTTDSPGGCADSYWLASTFAAAAVKINDGAGDPSCNGSVIPHADAGTDSGGGTDAGTNDAAASDATAD